MMRRTQIVGTLALGLMLTAAGTSPAFDRVVVSARSFQHYYRDLKRTSDSLSPWQRFMFSVVLANSNVDPTPPAGPQPVQHHS